MKLKPDEIELILVFKKDVPLDDAIIFLDKSGIAYREGMDSSRGKLYFYKTGPKFILTFASKRKRNKFQKIYQDSKKIHEIYIPDWKIQKD